MFLLTAASTTANAAAEAEHGIAVFGSYLNPGAAALEADAIGSDLTIQLRVVVTAIDGTPYHRVVSDGLPEPEARRLIERAKTRGRGHAWFSKAAAMRAVDPAGGCRHLVSSYTTCGRARCTIPYAADRAAGRRANDVNRHAGG